ncbi:MAG: hypothetical protein WBG70_15105 [Spirulinaceae cyanobacterium]
MVAYFTSAVTANRLQARITGLNDLINERVAAVAGTTSEEYLQGKPVKLSKIMPSLYQKKILRSWRKSTEFCYS